jgi:6-phosphogluconolactonase
MSDLRVFESIDDLSEAAADELLMIASYAVRERKECHIALSGGSTPKRLFEALVKRGRDAAPWDQITLWWGDERAVGPDDASSNFRMANEALIQPLQLKNFERIEGECESLEASAKSYAAKLERLAPDKGQFPVFDYVMLGMGSDGHTASLFPGSPALDATSEVIVANPVDSPLTKGPTTRITLTATTINWGRQLRFLVAGADKAPALAQVLRGPRDPKLYPSQLIQPINGHLAWYVDRAAACDLEKR